MHASPTRKFYKVKLSLQFYNEVAIKAAQKVQEILERKK